MFFPLVYFEFFDELLHRMANQGRCQGEGGGKYFYYTEHLRRRQS